MGKILGRNCLLNLLPCHIEKRASFHWEKVHMQNFVQSLGTKYGLLEYDFSNREKLLTLSHREEGKSPPGRNPLSLVCSPKWRKIGAAKDPDFFASNPW